MADCDVALGKPVDFEGKPVSEAKRLYETLFKLILVERAVLSGASESDALARFERLKSWLDSTDIYDAPASVRYHESIPHGLLAHTLKVYNEMCDLLKLDKFKGVSVQSAALVCLTHDWCKLGVYESFFRNVKNEETDEWDKVPSYRYTKKPQYPFGHGEASMYIAMQMFKLTKEEALAIRWHMGRWYVYDNALGDLQFANENYPLVLLLQFADSLAVANY